MPKMASHASASITKRFVDRLSKRYDALAGSKDLATEAELLAWLDALGDAKYLDKKHFVKLCMWKSPRQRRRYESNDPRVVKSVTRLAYEVDEESLKLHILTTLKGVGVPVASTILYFLHPEQFPIFDVRARSTLASAGHWLRRIDDQSPAAWLAYVGIMRELSRKHRVSLRSLDKALFACDKWPTNPSP